MDNPIPSAMVYFDEKERRAVLCLDEALLPPAVVSACDGGEGHEFHTHTWFKRGWLTETAFMTDRSRIKEMASQFVHDVLFCIIKIRDGFDRVQRERDEVRKINTNLCGIIRNLTSVLNNAVPYIESEKVRLKMFKAISKAQSHVLTKEDGDPQ